MGTFIPLLTHFTNHCGDIYSSSSKLLETLWRHLFFVLQTLRNIVGTFILFPQHSYKHCGDIFASFPVHSRLCWRTVTYLALKTSLNGTLYVLKTKAFYDPHWKSTTICVHGLKLTTTKLVSYINLLWLNFDGLWWPIPKYSLSPCPPAILNNPFVSAIFPQFNLWALSLLKYLLSPPKYIYIICMQAQLGLGLGCQQNITKNFTKIYVL